jgi:hypothetical protein
MLMRPDEGRMYPVHLQKKCRFACPIGSNDPDRFSMGNPERNTLEGLCPIRVSKNNVFEIDNMVAHLSG